MASHEERVERLQQRLTPPLRAAIASAIAEGRLPVPLRPDAAPPVAATRMPGVSLERLGLVTGPLAAAAPRQLPIMQAEAIIQRFGRPPLLVRDDKVVLEDLSDFPAGTDRLIRGVEPRIGAVGRIEFINHAMSWGGTGWVVRDAGDTRLVVTNRHVAALVARRRSDGRAIFVRNPFGQPYGAAINFLAEAGLADSQMRLAPLTGVEYLADDTAADVALLRIKADGFALPEPIRLFEGELRRGEMVAVIGYPAFDSRNNADDQARYFRDLYEVKRFAPGFVMQGPAGAAAFTHDCTTLGGNSGSPVIRLEDGLVAGLHFQGEYGLNNAAVTAATVAALLRGDRPVAVRLAVAPAERADGHHPAEHFRDREGFDTRFLGNGARVTPWPGLPAMLAGDLAQPSDAPDEPGELRYTHFGVKYSVRHRLPMMTAVNIDGASAIRIKRGDDQWFSDGRIAREIQLGSGNFADVAIDRGHMVRREDPNWGDVGDARLANDDTFHYVNAAPQHASLNQGKTLWQGLENYILDNARIHGLRACVFTGPVLRTDDEDDETVIDGATVPLEFWKLVVTLDARDRSLHATAYLLSQGDLIRRLLEQRSRREGLEGFTLGPYRTFQIAVADLAEATSYDFSPYVTADALRRDAAGQEGLKHREPVFLPLESPADIRL